GISRGPGQDIKVALDGECLLLNGRVVPVGKAGEEDAVVKVVSPAHARILQTGEDGRAGPGSMAEVRGENSALRSGAEQVLSIGYSVGQQGRVERVAGGELYGQFVVIRQIALVVEAHRAQAGFVKLVRHGVRGEGKAVHLERPVWLLIDVKVAFIPARGEVFGTHRWLVERMAGAAADQGQSDVRVVPGVDLVVGQAARSRVVAELAEVIVERAVLLHHHDNVLDSLQTRVGHHVHRGCGGGGVAARIRGGGGGGGIFRGRNRNAARGPGNRADSLIEAERGRALRCPAQRRRTSRRYVFRIRFQRNGQRGVYRCRSGRGGSTVGGRDRISSGGCRRNTHAS